ncbi:MAG: hypothetical protein AAGE01_05875 [Pseudomonadota bacterium]
MIARLLLLTVSLLPLTCEASTAQVLRMFAADNADSAVLDLLETADLATDAGLSELARALLRRARATGDASRYTVVLGLADAVQSTELAALLEAEALLGLHRFAEAQERLVQLGGSHRRDLLLGDALMEQGHHDRAARAYAAAQGARPGALAYGRLAALAFRRGEPEIAIAGNQRALRATHPQDTHLRSWLLTEASRYALAAAAPETAVALASAAVREAATIGARQQQAISLLAVDDATAALESLQQLAADYPSPEVLRALREALERQGHCDAARRVIRQIEALGDRIDPRGYARWLADAGEQPERALALVATELASRRDPETLGLAARLRLQQGEPERAMALLQEALSKGRPAAAVALVAADAHAGTALEQIFLKQAHARRWELPTTARRALEERLRAHGPPSSTGVDRSPIVGHPPTT